MSDEQPIIEEVPVPVKKGKRTTEYVVTAAMVDEEEQKYIGSYKLKKMNAEMTAMVNDRSVGIDPRTKTTLPKIGSQMLETVTISLIQAPFDLSNDANRRKMCREMPAWLVDDLYLIANALNKRLSDADIKN